MTKPDNPTSDDPEAEPLVVQPLVAPADDSPAAKLAAAAEEATKPPATPLGAEQKEAPGAGAKGEVTPPAEPPKEDRKYSQEEWNKREAAVQTQVTAAQTKAQEAVAAANQKAAEAVAAHQAREDQAYVDKVQAEGGDVEAARATIAKEAAVRAREAAIAEREASFQSEAAQFQEVAKRNDAERLARQYELTDVDALMVAENPVQMELLATQAALEVAKTGAKPPVKTDNAIPTAPAADWSKLTPQEKLLEGIKDMPGLQS